MTSFAQLAGEKRLAALVARTAIEEVIYRYCHAIDRAEWRLASDCFTHDATYQYGPIDGGVADFLTFAQAATGHLLATHHQIGNLLIDFADEDARVETYFTAYHRVPAEGPTEGAFACNGVEQEVVMAGRYVDRFVRVGEHWLIAHRRGVHDWWRSGPATDAGLYDTPESWRGMRHHGDPAHVVTKDW
jgi:hypothetical protein